MIPLVNNWYRSLFLLLSIALAPAVVAQDKQEKLPATDIVVPVKAQEANPITYVRLRALDKITARITEVEFALGEESRFGTLAITASYCRSTPPEETPESYAFLSVMDIQVDGSRDKVFEGWMIASSPAVTALEHAVYDVWVIGCKTVSPSEI
jgi:hypothetical protein